MVKYIDVRVPAIRDASDRSLEIRKRQGPTVYDVMCCRTHAYRLRVAVSAFGEGKRAAWGARQSQEYEIDLVHFRNRPEVGRGREAQS